MHGGRDAVAGPGQDQRFREVLEIAENKAQAQGDSVVLLDTRLKLADWYKQKSEHDKAIEYYNKLLATTGLDERIRIKIEEALIEAYLVKADMENVAQLVKSRLVSGDLSNDDCIIDNIQTYLNSDAAAETKIVLVKALKDIEFEGERPWWSQQLEDWYKRVMPPTE